MGIVIGFFASFIVLKINEEKIDRVRNQIKSIENYIKTVDKFELDRKSKTFIQKISLENALNDFIDLEMQMMSDITSKNESLFKEIKSLKASRSYASSIASKEINKLSPLEFEHYVSTYFELKGFEVSVTQYTGDGGVDIELRDSTGRLSVVQCKKYTNNKVSTPEVIQFLGVIVDKKAYKGYFVTTSDFVKNAINKAQEHGIELINGKALKEDRATVILKEKAVINQGKITSLENQIIANYKTFFQRITVGQRITVSQAKLLKLDEYNNLSRDINTWKLNQQIGQLKKFVNPNYLTNNGIIS